ncbi:hypothetical protein BCV69DRAFT_300548 [Microstroma glucosiphilum]|uniref:Uncharacterized protein n=1 Tax=Pseudomicrostroma glucosiphilum TaxID=1684307 RepID=A0A316U347_9BASI|nr:hypothetical protein BCV69DRAFT_300548 [Pseudomicrostroma glucosiphilum]PWN19224.1 hypothetical protein BCV69DRAFT_300548 [Pseudomicrostroma glucosiphilum]
MGLKTPRVYEQVLLDKFRPFVEQTLRDIKASKSDDAYSRLLGSPSRGRAAESEELRRLTFEQWVDKVDFKDEYWQRLHDIIVDSFVCDRTSTPVRYLESAHDQAARASTSSWAPMPRPSRYLAADSSDSDDALPTINVRTDSGTSLRRTRSLRRVGRFQRTAAGDLSASTSRNRLVHDGAELQGVEVPPLLPWLGATTRATSSSFPDALGNGRVEEPFGPTSAFAAGLMSPRRVDQSTGEVVRSDYGPANYFDEPEDWPPEMDFGALVDDDLGEKVEVLYGALECYKYNMLELENSFRWQDRAFGRGVERIMPRMTALVEEMDGLRRLRRHWLHYGAGAQSQVAAGGRDNRRTASRLSGPSQVAPTPADVNIPALASSSAASRSSAILPSFAELASAALPTTAAAAAASSSTIPDDPSSWSWAMPPEELRALTPTSFEEFTALGRAAGRSRMRSRRRRRRGVATEEEEESEDDIDDEEDREGEEEDRRDTVAAEIHDANGDTQGPGLS